MTSQPCSFFEPLDFFELAMLLLFEESKDETIFLLALLEGLVLPSLIVLPSSASFSALALAVVLPSSSGSEPSSALALLRLSVSEDSDVSLALA